MPDEETTHARTVEAQEAHVAKLDRELSEARAALAALRQQASSTSRREPLPLPLAPDSGTTQKLSVPGKIALFRSLFRGRDDIYPKYWHNAERNRSGYAPACANEWVRGVCEKPRVKCGECPNRAFHSVTDQVIEDHLRGRHVVGVYPLLADDTTWFLAVDFDEESWRDDVAAFVETCGTFGLTPSVERSRSGNGAHVWFFFDAPIVARTARTVGCFLLTETMARRHQVKLASYDRLFPNQDTLPKGGFGNLIALPLQRAAAEQGNTLFLDDVGQPLADQWLHLASVQRSTAAIMQALATEAERSSSVLSARAVVEDEEITGHSSRRGAGRQLSLSPAPRLEVPLPDHIDVVLSHQLLVSTHGLPSPLITAIRQLASFQNPEFYKRQRLRLSTHETPRVISCAELLPEALALPRACLSDLQHLLSHNGVALALLDQRTLGQPIAASFLGKLSAEQSRMVDILSDSETGVLVAPPGSGKTVMAVALLARRARSTLILVHRRLLVQQWVSRLAVFLGIPEREVGQVTSGKRRVTGAIDVATVQSLVHDGEVDELVSTYGHVIVDECHHVAAFSIERVLSRVRARYVLGLTATPTRCDALQPIVHMQLGPVRCVMGRPTASSNVFSHALIVHDTPFVCEDREWPIQELYAALGASGTRNDQLCDDIIHALHEGRSPIVLTERRDHLEYLADRLRPFTRHLVVLHGGKGVKANREDTRRLAELPPDEERLIVATGRYVGEGFDDARLDTLFLAMPVAWRGTLVQYAGRLQRAYAGKRDVQVHDYVDRAVPVLQRMHEKRLRGYRAMGFELRS